MGYFILNPDSDSLSESEIHHITRVLRLKQGNHIQCTDTQRHLVTLEIVSIHPFITKVHNSHIIPRQYPYIRMIISSIKIPLLEIAIQKITELGVDEIIITETEYSQVSLDSIQAKLPRFEQIIITAMKQSEQVYKPTLSLLPLRDIEYHKGEENYIGDTQYAQQTSHILEYIQNIDSTQSKKISLFIGPEGGFAPSEYDTIIHQGYTPVKLSPYILRTETACIVGAGIISTLKARI